MAAASNTSGAVCEIAQNATGDYNNGSALSVYRQPARVGDIVTFDIGRLLGPLLKRGIAQRVSTEADLIKQHLETNSA